MKQIIFALLICLISFGAFAQPGTDSAAYQMQRTKINNMLADRSAKFGQYDQSLSMHTGIFGFQTKKDIRRSNDILMDIVKTDDDIYKQLKILLDYRLFQQTQVQDKSKETENNNVAYMSVINKLRAQNEKLIKQADDAQRDNEKSNRNYIIIIVLMAASILWLLIRKYAVKP